MTSADPVALNAAMTEYGLTRAPGGGRGATPDEIVPHLPGMAVLRLGPRRA